VSIFAVASVSSAFGHQHLEAWYQAGLAAETGARREVRMHDGTRCDVLTATHAVEVEFAAKWCEAVGQSLGYAAQTGRAGGIALILERPSDQRFLERLRALIAFHGLPIDVVVLKPCAKDGLEIDGVKSLTRPARAWLQGAPIATLDLTRRREAAKDRTDRTYGTDGSR
jgi:hypothetical protein